MDDVNVRKYALDLLCDIERNGKYANIALDAQLNRCKAAGSDRALLAALVYGVIERKITLDYIIAALSLRKPDSIDKRVRNILRLGLYQIRYMNKIPAHAAVNESVALAKNRGESAFVNAVLRAYLRRGADIEFPDKSSDPVYAMSVQYSVSEWICRLICDAYGVQTADAILESMSVQPDITLRVNTLKITRDDLLLYLNESWANAVPAELSEYGIRLPKGSAVTSVPGFDEGMFFVQDEASQLCVKALDPISGQLVIDTCSAPGSKSFSAAILMGNMGTIFSFDIHKSRLNMIKDGAKRLGISIIRAEECDAKKPMAELLGRADSVLCDVPCSGLGVLAKKPDIRYKEENTVTQLPDIQYNILRASAAYVKPGGTLVYSTCTINPSENESVVLRFLREAAEFAPCDFSFSPSVSSVSGMLTLLPNKHHTDGFFIAKMKRNI